MVPALSRIGELLVKVDHKGLLSMNNNAARFSVQLPWKQPLRHTRWADLTLDLWDYVESFLTLEEQMETLHICFMDSVELSISVGVVGHIAPPKGLFVSLPYRQSLTIARDGSCSVTSTRDVAMWIHFNLPQHLVQPIFRLLPQEDEKEDEEEAEDEEEEEEEEEAEEDEED